MLFSVEPKHKASDLFNREKEIKNLTESAEKDKIIILYGLRRIGKTSLLKTYLNTTDHYNVFMDCRAFFTENRVDKVRFENELLSALTNEMKRNKLISLLKNISSINLKGIELQISGKKDPLCLADVLKEVDSVMGKKSKRLIIAFDEAQILRFYGKDGSDLLYLMAYCYDNLDNIVFMLTGSEIGLLFDFLKLEDPEMPLFGRYIQEISLSRFEPPQSKEFLKKGMQELGHTISDNNLEKVVARLDGIVGYLSIFGYECYRNDYDIEKSLEKAENLADSLVKQEISSLVNRSLNYAYCLNAIALNMNRFSLIKKFIQANYGGIYDSTLSNILNSLQKHSIIDVEYNKRKKIYYFPDPVVQRYCAAMRF